MIHDDVRGWTRGRLLCELTAFVAGLTLTGLYASPGPPAVRLHISAAAIESPFSPWNLAEQDPPVPNRVSDSFLVVSTTGTGGPTQATWLKHWSKS
jgi:hypothetical protein